MADEEKVLAPFTLKGLNDIGDEFSRSEEETIALAQALTAKELKLCMHGNNDPRSCPYCDERRRAWKERRPI